MLHEGWSVLTLADDRVLAGLLRFEHVGMIEQWALDVPANGVHRGYTAILSPKSIIAVEPCTQEEAQALSRATAPAPLHAMDDPHAYDHDDARRSA